MLDKLIDLFSRYPATQEALKALKEMDDLADHERELEESDLWWGFKMAHEATREDVDYEMLLDEIWNYDTLPREILLDGLEADDLI